MTILSNGHQWKFSEFLDNKDYSFSKKNILSSLSEKEIDDAYSSISKWEGYAPTPLVSLNKLSKELNLNNIYYKDESKDLI
jgi:diaminopropionate ammonia-lyase